jgi:hypothetical protein
MLLPISFTLPSVLTGEITFLEQYWACIHKIDVADLVRKIIGENRTKIKRRGSRLFFHMGPGSRKSDKGNMSSYCSPSVVFCWSCAGCRSYFLN